VFFVFFRGFYSEKKKRPGFARPLPTHYERRAERLFFGPARTHDDVGSETYERFSGRSYANWNE